MTTNNKSKPWDGVSRDMMRGTVRSLSDGGGHNSLKALYFIAMMISNECVKYSCTAHDPRDRPTELYLRKVWAELGAYFMDNENE